MQGRIVSVQVGTSRFLRAGDRTVRSAIRKQPVDGPVEVADSGAASRSAIVPSATTRPSEMK